MKSRSISAAVLRMCFFRLWLFSLDGAPARWVEFEEEFWLSLDWSLSSLPEEEYEEWLEWLRCLALGSLEISAWFPTEPSAFCNCCFCCC